MNLTIGSLIEVYNWEVEPSSILIILAIYDNPDYVTCDYTNDKLIKVYDVCKEQISKDHSLYYMKKWIANGEAVILYDNI